MSDIIGEGLPEEVLIAPEQEESTVVLPEEAVEPEAESGEEIL